MRPLESRVLTVVCVGIAVHFGSAAARSGDFILPHTEEAVQRGLVYDIQPLFSEQGLGFGMAVVDLNGNGHQDVVVMGHPTGLIGFFENDGTGHFVDRSFHDSEGNDPKWVMTRPSGLAVADYNGDGMLDIYLTQQKNQTTGAQYPNFLLRNEGGFMFSDVTAAAGVHNMGNSQGAAWGDFDNDGWLDLYLNNYSFSPPDPVDWNRLFQNRGDGTFVDVSVQQTVNNGGMSFTAAFTDINRNGWLDLYIANDRGHYPGLPENQLWRNDNGQYENICETSGACLGLYSMCVAVGDYTGNGYPDFYITNIAHPAAYNGWNPLIVNQGDDTFTEECAQAGVCSVLTSWAAIFYDYDNNGWLDIYVCNQGASGLYVPNRLYSNTGVYPANQVAAAAAVQGNSGWSYNAAVGDVTGNGALDLILNNYGPVGGPPVNVELFINHEGARRNWIRFDVVGHDGNLHAIGANIEVTADGHTQWREIYAGGNNYKAQNELVFHFGMDDAAVADEIIVNWPGLRGSRTLSNYPANQRWRIYPEEMLGDADGNGVINVFDLLALLSNWGAIQPGTERMDMNGDGTINVFDLLGLLGKWGALP